MIVREEVVITAFGASTPIGADYNAIKSALIQGISGIKENNKFDCHDFILKHAGIPDEGNEAIRWPGRTRVIGESFYAKIAAERLKQHPAYPHGEYSDDRMGCVIGVDEPPENLQLCVDLIKEGNGGLVKKDLLDQLKRTLRLSDAYNNDPSSALNSIYQEIPFSGYAKCHLGLCSASLQAISMAYNAIQSGKVDAVIAGGVSGKVNPISAARLELIGAISLDLGLDPTARSRPFDKRRSGFVLAEGGVLFLLEKKSVVEKRREKGLLKILGYGASLASEHIVAPHKKSLEMQLAMERALANAGISPKQVDLVNAHGTSTVLNDLHESDAINKIFENSNPNLKVTANKSLHGHLIAAAGAMEVLNTLISVNEGFIPATINLDDQDENCQVEVQERTENANLSIVLKNSFGMGGLAASMILGSVHYEG